MVITNQPFLCVGIWKRVNVFVCVAGEQRRRRWRVWRGRRWCGASCGLLRSVTQPLSASGPGSDCLPAAWCWRWLPASSCLPTLPRTLHLPAYGRENSLLWLSLFTSSKSNLCMSRIWLKIAIFFSFILVSLFFAAFYILATEDIKTMKQDIWNYVANKKKSNNSLYVLYFLFCSQSSHPLLSLGLISMNFMRWSSEMVPTSLPCLVMVNLWNFLPF